MNEDASNLVPNPSWPGEVDTRGLVDDLNEEQRRRALALHHARAVLARRAPFAASSAPEISDLIRTARWILEGEDRRR